MKKVIAVLMCICFVFTLCGCTFLKDVADSAGVEQPKTFEFDGLSLELTTKFLRMDFVSEDADFVLGTENITVYGVKAEVDDIYNVSVMDYAEYFRDAFADYNPTELTEVSYIPTFNYDLVDSEGKSQRAAVMFYKGTDCFWVVTFSTYTDKFDETYDEICGYAKTVKCD